MSCGVLHRVTTGVLYELCGVTEGDCKTSVTAVQTGLIILGCVAGLLVIILACFLCCEQVKRT